MGFLDTLKEMLKSPQEKGCETFRACLDSLPQAEVRRDGKYHKRNYATRDLGEFKYKSLTKSTSLNKLVSFVAIDTETTGISLTDNEVIEVAAIRFEFFRPVEVFSTLLCPKNPIPAESIAIHHITNEMVANAPKFYEIIPSLDGFLGKTPLVAHNASFDVMHLYACGLDSIAKKSVYDTCDISRKLCKQLPDHKLATCCASHGIFFDGAHRSAADTLACGELFVGLIMQIHGCKTVQELQQKLK